MGEPISDAGKRQRLSADPNIKLSDIAKCVEDYLAVSGTRDLHGLLQDAASTATWKTSPGQSVDALAGLAPLLRTLAEVAPNGVLPPKLTAKAILTCHQNRPCNFSRKDDLSFSDHCSSVLRVCMSKMRDLRNDPLGWQRCLRKATGAQIEAIKSIIDLLQCDKSSGASRAASPADQGTDLALVPVAPARSPRQLAADEEGWPTVFSCFLQGKISSKCAANVVISVSANTVRPPAPADGGQIPVSGTLSRCSSVASGITEKLDASMVALEASEKESDASDREEDPSDLACLLTIFPELMIFAKLDSFRGLLKSFCKLL
jgi:hypothetical protein